MFVASLFLLTCLALVIHELGHLIAARSCKVPCSELGLGLGPKLLAFRIGTIQFSVRAIPLGSFVMLDSSVLKTKSVKQQLYVHLAGILFNLVAGFATFGTVFSWINLLIAAGNILPLYQHDGWKCGVVLMRAFFQRKSQPAEWAFTFSGGFASLAVAWVVIRMYL